MLDVDFNDDDEDDDDDPDARSRGLSVGLGKRVSFGLSAENPMGASSMQQEFEEKVRKDAGAGGSFRIAKIMTRAGSARSKKGASSTSREEDIFPRPSDVLPPTKNPMQQGETQKRTAANMAKFKAAARFAGALETSRKKNALI